MRTVAKGSLGTLRGPQPPWLITVPVSISQQTLSHRSCPVWS